MDPFATSDSIGHHQYPLETQKTQNFDDLFLEVKLTWKPLLAQFIPPKVLNPPNLCLILQKSRLYATPITPTPLHQKAVQNPISGALLQQLRLREAQMPGFIHLDVREPLIPPKSPKPAPLLPDRLQLLQIAFFVVNWVNLRSKVTEFCPLLISL